MLENGVADRVTIYRIIQALAEKGIIREVNLRHNHVDYEMADSGDHHHIVCVKCNLVKDFDGCNAEKLERAVLKQCPEFKIVSEHAIELFGTCKKCAESA